MKALYINENNFIVHNKVTPIEKLTGFNITDASTYEIVKALKANGYKENTSGSLFKTKSKEFFIKNNKFIKVKTGKSQITIVNKVVFCKKASKFSLDEFVNELNSLGINDNIGKFCLEKEREFIKNKIGLDYYNKFIDEMSRAIVKSKDAREVYSYLSTTKGGGLCVCRYEDSSYKDVYCYDFHSMYPSIAKNNPLPFGVPTKVIACKTFKKIDGYIGYYKVSFTNKYYKDELFRFEDGWYFQNEIERALELGYKIKFEKCIFWKAETGYFDEWVDWLWDLKNNGNPIQKVVAKQGLNTTLGKLSQGAKDYKSKSYRDYSFRSLVTQRYITAVGRMNISKIAQYIINKYGEKAYLYTDTDSIHTTLNEDEFKKVCIELGFTYGEDLGDISLEKAMDKVVYKAKKHYAYIDKNTKEINYVISGETTMEHKKELENELVGGNECNEKVMTSASSTKALTWKKLKQILSSLGEVILAASLLSLEPSTPASICFMMNVRKETFQ